MAELLIDSVPLTTMSLEESKTDSNKIIMRGQFARSDRATENKRLYKESLWRREFGRLRENIDRRRMFGELDHPNDGRTKLARVSHLVTSLNIRGNEVIGEAEILDTPNGRILKALAAAKAEVGVSSRGYGSTKTLPDGTQEVQEDFRLDTFDFVADPATKTAYPAVVSEERAIHEAEETMTLDLLKEKYPGLVAEAASGDTAPSMSLIESEDRTKRQLTEQFSVSLRRAIELIEDEVRDEVRSELMSDPKVAGAYGIVEQIVSLVKSYGIDPQAHEDLMGKDENITKLEGKIQEKALEIHALEKKISEQSKLMREMANKLRLEQLLAKDPSREAIEALIGDISKCESISEIDEKVKVVKAELDRRAPEQKVESDGDKLSDARAALESAKARVTELEQALEGMTSKKDEAKSEAEKAREVAEKALSHAENLEARLHAEEAIRGNAGLTEEDANVIRTLVEDVTTSEDVDRIIGAYQPRRTKDTDEVSRIREAAQRGKSHDLLEEHGSGVRTGAGSNPLSGVGLDGAEFDRLVGPANKA